MITIFASIQHKFHDDYKRNSPVPPHYMQSNTLNDGDRLPQPEPEVVNEEPIRRKKQNEARKAAVSQAEEHPYAYENQLMTQSSEKR